MAKQCPSCQQLLDEAARFCPVCGASVESVRSLDAPIELPPGQLPPPLIPGSPEATSAGLPSAGLPSAGPRLPPPLPVSGPPNLLKPAFLGGLTLGLLSALPLVNCCCLLWIGGGGLLAVYLLRQDFAGEITAGIGAKIGFLAGMIGALFWQILELPLAYLTNPRRVEQLEELLQNREIPPWIESMFSLLSDPLNPFVLVGLLSFKALACGLLTTLGGIIGAAFWGKPRA